MLNQICDADNRYHSLTNEFQYLLDNPSFMWRVDCNTADVKDVLRGRFLGSVVALGISVEQADDIFDKVAIAFVNGSKCQASKWLNQYLLRLIVEGVTGQSLGYIDKPEYLNEYREYAIDHLAHFGCLPLEFASYGKEEGADEVEFGDAPCWEAAGRLGLLIGDELPNEEQINQLINTQAIN